MYSVKKLFIVIHCYTHHQLTFSNDSRMDLNMTITNLLHISYLIYSARI